MRRIRIHWENIPLVAICGILGAAAWVIWTTTAPRHPTAMESEASDLVQEIDAMYLRALQLPPRSIRMGRSAARLLQTRTTYRVDRALPLALNTPDRD